MAQKIIPITGLPRSGNMNAQQVYAYRALLAFQLRATGMEHVHIAAVLNQPTKETSRKLVARGRRVMLDCIVGTVMP